MAGFAAAPASPGHRTGRDRQRGCRSPTTGIEEPNLTRIEKPLEYIRRATPHTDGGPGTGATRGASPAAHMPLGPIGPGVVPDVASPYRPDFCFPPHASLRTRLPRRHGSRAGSGGNGRHPAMWAGPLRPHRRGPAVPGGRSGPTPTRGPIRNVGLPRPECTQLAQDFGGGPDWRHRPRHSPWLCRSVRPLRYRAATRSSELALLLSPLQGCPGATRLAHAIAGDTSGALPSFVTQS